MGKKTRYSPEPEMEGNKWAKGFHPGCASSMNDPEGLVQEKAVFESCQDLREIHSGIREPQGSIRGHQRGGSSFRIHEVIVNLSGGQTWCEWRSKSSLVQITQGL